MGGFGSGRPPGWGRDKAEWFTALDVRWLLRSGALEPGRQSTWRRTRSDGTVALLAAMRAEKEHLVLAYSVRINGGEPEDVVQRIRLTWFPCHYGGERPYFMCPGVNGAHCGRRALKLFGADREFACRYCHRLANASCSESPAGRAERRLEKVWRRLGGGSVVNGAPFPPRPKGMHHTTYARLMARAQEADAVAAKADDRRLRRLVRHMQRSDSTRR